MTAEGLTIESSFTPTRRRSRTPATSVIVPEAEPGRVPRVARLLALALRFEQLVQRREVRDYAHLALLGQVSRARITQIMNLLLLTPDIQEEILFLPAIHRGHDCLRLAHLQPIAQIPLWSKQRVLWARQRERLTAWAASPRW